VYAKALLILAILYYADGSLSSIPGKSSVIRLVLEEVSLAPVL